VSGLFKADWLRFRKRGALQVMVIAVPVVVAFFYLAGFRGTDAGIIPFDEAAFRQQMIDGGAVVGLPPAEAEAQLEQMVDNERVGYQQMIDQMRRTQSTYAFPQSFILVLGFATFAFFALTLISATTLGDEFGWGTIRTSLLASSDRGRFLTARVLSLVGVAVVLFAALLVLGVLLPGVLAVTGSNVPAAPPVDPGWLAVLVLADLVISITLIGFATMATVLVRSGGLALIAVLVYVAIEGALLSLLTRFDAFQDAGSLQWILNLFPFRATLTILDKLAVAAGRVQSGFYPGSNVQPDPGAALLPLAALAVWGALFLAIAFWRFRRMDIVE
jgi:ABC-type transport system involved in multi-copper enzyme maturation permease subunit